LETQSRRDCIPFGYPSFLIAKGYPTTKTGLDPMPSKIENPKHLLAAAWRNFGFSSMETCRGFANSQGGTAAETWGMVSKIETFKNQRRAMPPFEPKIIKV